MENINSLAITALSTFGQSGSCSFQGILQRESQVQTIGNKTYRSWARRADVRSKGFLRGLGSRADNAHYKEINKLIVKLTWKCKEPSQTKIIWKKRSKAGVLILPDFKTYSKSTLIKSSVVWT